MVKKTIELEAKTDKAVKEIEALKEEIIELNKKVTEGTKDINNNLKDVSKEGKKSFKVLSGISKLFKGALGLGIVVSAFNMLKDVFMQNQKVADTFATAMEAISLVFNQFVNVIIDTYESVSSAKENFDALGQVLQGVLTIVITPLKLAFLGIKMGLQQAQLAWEQSFFGGKDADKIAELKLGILETKAAVFETGKDAVEAGKSIVTNFSEAVSEVGAIANTVAENTSKISIKAAIESAKTNVQLGKSAEIARVKQQGLIETYDRQAEQLRQIRDDDTKSIEERIKANDDLKEVLDEQTEAMLAQVQVQIDAAQAQYDKNASQENYIALLEAQQEKEAVLAQIEGFRSEQISNRISLEREREEEIKEKEEEEAEKAELAKEKLIEDAELLDELEQKKRNSKKQTVDTISNLVGQETALGKAALLAKQFLVAQEFILDAKSQISNAKKALSDAGTTGAQAGVEVAGSVAKSANSAPPPWNIPFIISAIATGAGIISSVKSAIGATKAAASRAGAGGGATPAISAPTTTASAPPAFNVVGASGENQLAETIAGQTQRPVKAFVTSQDVTTSQSLERNIVEGASI